LNALFIAPPEPAVVTVSASVASGTPTIEIPLERQCIVTSKDNPAPPAVPTTGSGVVDSSPVLQVTIASPVPQSLQYPSFQIRTTVVISEVMANPCGPVVVRKWNEYVELYNYGDQPVDVGGWWLADVGDVELLINWFLVAAQPE
jgi:hypothetical protein